MKKLIALAILGLVAASANAAGTYKLTKINSYNPFDPTGSSVLIGPIPVAGVATVDGAGNVSASGISHSFVNGNFTYNYTGGVWSAVVGGTSITHTETCVELSSSPCSNLFGGFAGPNWDNVLQNFGAVSNACPASLTFGAGN